jgi:hypothetical protein
MEVAVEKASRDEARQSLPVLVTVPARLGSSLFGVAAYRSLETRAFDGFDAATTDPANSATIAGDEVVASQGLMGLPLHVPFRVGDVGYALPVVAPA